MRDADRLRLLRAMRELARQYGRTLGQLRDLLHAYSGGTQGLMPWLLHNELVATRHKR